MIEGDKIPESNYVYLGDAVYAEYDGYNINLRLNDHQSNVLIVLEPIVVNALENFIKSITKDMP